MKIDLHVHSRERSACGKSSEEEQIQAAIRAGLDALVFSDHDRLLPRTRLRELNQKYAPFKIFGGIEVSTWDPHTGSFEHILVPGLEDPRLEAYRWSYTELYEFVREQDGFFAIAHLFRFNDTTTVNLDAYRPDALEGYSNNISADLRVRLTAVAQQLQVPRLSNSDAHHTKFIGQYYNELLESPATAEELIAILKAGQYTCVFPTVAENLTGFQ
jgi:predicted metal-dependent phosphoesterase TrpH